MCSYLMLEIISFVSLKNDSLLFSMREHVKGELSSPKWRVAHEGEGGLTDLDFFLGGGLGKKGWGQYFRGWYPVGHYETINSNIIILANLTLAACIHVLNLVCFFSVIFLFFLSYQFIPATTISVPVFYLLGILI